MNEYLCTNGDNSSFRVKAETAEEALKIAISRFDHEGVYILPITAESETGEIAEVAK